MRTLIEDLVCDLGRDSEAAGGIFRVDHHQIDRLFLDHMGEVLAYDAPSCLPEDVAYKQNSQRKPSPRTPNARGTMSARRLPRCMFATLEVTNVPSVVHLVFSLLYVSVPAWQ